MDTSYIHDENDPLVKTCPQCHEDFKVRSPSEITTRKYCSRECQVESTRKTKISLKCEICKREILIAPCLSKTKYCSLDCKYIGTRKIKDTSLRQCNKCKKVLPLSEYYTSDLYRCKSCERTRSYHDTRTPRGRFSFSKSLAKRRGYEWDIPKDSYFELLKQPCHYCKMPLSNTGVGLDRTDNKNGYSLSNVVPSCGLCNVTRGDNYSHEEMHVLAETIRHIKLNRKEPLMRKEKEMNELATKFNELDVEQSVYEHKWMEQSTPQDRCLDRFVWWHQFLRRNKFSDDEHRRKGAQFVLEKFRKAWFNSSFSSPPLTEAFWKNEEAEKTLKIAIEDYHIERNEMRKTNVDGLATETVDDIPDWSEKWDFLYGMKRILSDLKPLINACSSSST